MSLSMQPTAPVSSAVVRAAHNRLRDHVLLLARVVWIATALLIAVMLFLALPVELARLQVICIGKGPCIGWTPVQAHIIGSAGRQAVALYLTAVEAIFAAIFGAVAVVLFWRRSTERMALLGAYALLTFGTATFPRTMTILALFSPGWQAPVAILTWCGSSALTLLFFWFPDGRFVPRWVWIVTLPWLLAETAHYFLPASALNYEHWPTPWQFALFIGALGSMVMAQIYRYRSVSSPEQRQQTKWVVYGLSVALGAYLGIITAYSLLLPAALQRNVYGGLLAETAAYVMMMLIPLSIGMAVLRYRLWDVDLLINRTLVYGALTVVVVGLYVGVVGALGQLFRAHGNEIIALVGTGMVAVVFEPLRERLQRAVNRMLYGERDEPYRVLSRLGQRLEATLAPDTVLTAIVETVAQALRLPYVAIALSGEGNATLAASYGTAVVRPMALDLMYQREQVGQLLLVPRTPGEPLTPADQRLLNDLARQAGIAAHAVQLTAALRQSRERIITAREEERRRLRRDLHDGLGPMLASLLLKVSAARRHLPPESPADALLIEMRADMQVAIADIRRLVYALRPPALDELGLVGAVREQAARYGAGEGDTPSPSIWVEAPDRLPSLPAAVEVAAYRIAQEALTNVIRHAGAKTCTVRLSVDDALEVEIVDDGVGLPELRSAGVGIVSMRERAEELGGSCAVAARPKGGTRVLARLPLVKE